MPLPHSQIPRRQGSMGCGPGKRKSRVNNRHQRAFSSLATHTNTYLCKGLHVTARRLPPGETQLRSCTTQEKYRGNRMTRHRLTDVPGEGAPTGKIDRPKLHGIKVLLPTCYAHCLVATKRPEVSSCSSAPSSQILRSRYHKT